MTGLEVLYRELALPGNWQLGSGQRTIWAPRCPKHLDRPGFRDAGSYMGHAIDPVFAVSILDERATPIQARAMERNWNPARLELKYSLPSALITERRAILSYDTFISQWTITHSANISQYYWLVLWTRRPDGIAERRISDIEANPRGASFQESVIDSEGNEKTKWGCALGANFDADSWSVNGAESAGADVTWSATPFLDLMAPGGLPGHLPQHESADGHLFFALAYPF